jgi:hypothetical protein
MIEVHGSAYRRRRRRRRRRLAFPPPPTTARHGNIDEDKNWHQNTRQQHAPAAACIFLFLILSLKRRNVWGFQKRSLGQVILGKLCIHLVGSQGSGYSIGSGFAGRCDDGVHADRFRQQAAATDDGRNLINDDVWSATDTAAAIAIDLLKRSCLSVVKDASVMGRDTANFTTCLAVVSVQTVAADPEYLPASQSVQTVEAAPEY